jgi:hypothetical protein
MKPDGTSHQYSPFGGGHKEYQMEVGQKVQLMIDEYTTATARILVDGEVYRSQTNGGFIHLQGHVPAP